METNTLKPHAPSKTIWAEGTKNVGILADRGFWAHHFAVALIASCIIYGAALIGAFGDLSGTLPALFHAVLVASTGVVTQTAGAVFATLYFNRRHIRNISHLGCAVASAPAALFSICVLYGFDLVANFLPSAEWNSHSLLQTFSACLVLHAALGSSLWAVLGFRWWQSNVFEHGT